jgi:hypothetical protein
MFSCGLLRPLKIAWLERLLATGRLEVAPFNIHSQARAVSLHAAASPGSQSCARGASNISQRGNASRQAPRCCLNFTVKDLSD